MRPRPERAGMLLAQLPNEILAVCAGRLETTARSFRAKGDPRNLEQLRADVRTALLLNDGAETDRKSSAESSGQVGRVGRIRPAQAVVNIHVRLGTVLRLDDHDATIDGYGPVPAEAARELLADPNNVVRQVLTGPDTGTVVGIGRRRYRPSARQRDYVHARDQHCRTPGCARPIAEIDHVKPWHHHGRTDPANLQGLCRTDHTLKALPGGTTVPARSLTR